MKTINMGHVTLARVVGPDAISFYPEGFKLPMTTLVREAYREYKEQVHKEPTRFEFPGMGTLTMHGRDYKFEPTDAYRKQKKGLELMPYEGRWG